MMEARCKCQRGGGNSYLYEYIRIVDGTFTFLGESEDATLEDRGAHAPNTYPHTYECVGFVEGWMMGHI